jgi:hypothetical protein
VIRAFARIDADGLLLDFEAVGHAGKGSRGFDIVCAAFTVLVRTAYSALAGLPGARIEDRAAEPGSLDFHMESLPDGMRERAIGMSAFLLEGLRALEGEYPEAVEIRTELRRK